MNNKKMNNKTISVFLATITILITALLGAMPAFGDAGSSAADLAINLLNQDPDPVEPGNYIELRFSVENYGFGAAQNVMAEILPEYPFSLDPGASKQKTIGKIAARQMGENKVIMYYKLRVDNDAIEGNTDLDMRYSLDGGTTWSQLDPFTLRIRSTNSILSVNDVITVPEKVGPGETVKVTIKLKNDATTRLKDIKAVLSLYTTTTSGATTTLEELPLTPVGSGVEKTIDKLDAGKETEVVFNLIVDADATNKPYKVPLTITYTDQYGEEFTKSNILGIVVYKKPDYTLNIESSDIYTNNKKGSVIISISNTGPSDINYLTFKLKESNDYNVISTPNVYLGNLESDDYETAEFDIFVNSKKEKVPLQIELSYKDSYNTGYKETVLLPGIDLFSQKEAIKYGLLPKPNTAGSIIALMIFGLLGLFWVYMFIDLLRHPMARYKKILWVLAFLLANIVGSVLYYFIGRKKKKRVE